MTVESAAPPTMAEDTTASGPLLIVHRNLPGEHTSEDACWCCPHVFRVADGLMVAEMVEEAARRERRH